MMLHSYTLLVTEKTEPKTSIYPLYLCTSFDPRIFGCRSCEFGESCRDIVTETLEDWDP
jgi:hypothetical protein